MVYDVIIPFIPFLAGYLCTYTLYRKQYIRKSIHAGVWNYIMIIAFLISAGGGLLYLFLLKLGIKTPIGREFLYWHVELALLMIIGTLIHIHIYRKQFKKLFKASAFKSTKET